MKFKYIVVYENNSDKFDVGHWWTKVKVTACNFEIFLHLLQFKLSGPMTFAQAKNLILSVYVYLIILYNFINTITLEWFKEFLQGVKIW